VNIHTYLTDFTQVLKWIIYIHRDSDIPLSYLHDLKPVLKSEIENQKPNWNQAHGCKRRIIRKREGKRERNQLKKLTQKEEDTYKYYILYRHPNSYKNK